MAKMKRIQVSEDAYQSLVDLAKSNGVNFKTEKEIVETFIKNDFLKMIDTLTNKIEKLEEKLNSKNLISIDDDSIVRIEKLKALEVLPTKQEEIISTMLKSFVESNEAAIEAAIKKI